MSIFHKLQSLIRQYGICYLMAVLIIFGIKYFYNNRAEAEMLEWILAPTARWSGILTGAAFEKQPHVGYVSHSLQFIIAPTCSGTQFMMITIAALVFGFVHHMGNVRRGLCWTAGSVAVSYLSTVFVNGVRIACAVFIPHRLPPGIYGGWFTPDRLHTVIGIVVYFTSLLMIYDLTEYFLRKIKILAGKDTGAGIFMPVFWYFFIALGIPFLNRAYERYDKSFTEYAILLAGICPVLLGLFYLIIVIRKHFK